MSRKSDPRTVQIHLLRHADAGDPEKWSGPEEARPLSEKGQRQAERLGQFLASIGFRAEAVVTSPKVRAAQTAGIVAAAFEMEVTIDERLAAGFGLTALGELLDELRVIKPVLVGHDPDFSELLSALSGAERLELKKGALGRVDLKLPARNGGGALRWLLPPDLFGRG